MQTYALTTVLLPLMALASIATTNWLVDPYQIFSADRQGTYTSKPALHANARLHKAYQVSLQKPDTLILGSSKAIQGIPTKHALFEKARVYNLAMPLASMKELTYLLKHANTVAPTKNVILALDFLSFNVMARKDGPASGFQPDRLLGHEHSRSTPLQDYMAALMSLDALMASLEAVQAGQLETNDEGDFRTPEHRVLTGLGGREDAEIRSRLNDGGHRSNTLKIEEFFTDAVYLPSPHRQFRFKTADEDSLYWFEQFLRTLHQNNITASLFISPSHARLNELIDAAGLWPEFEQWKRRMLALSTLVAAEFGQEPYLLWDFSVPTHITTEPFPDAGNSTFQMRYYYESIHFNQHTGSLVLDRLLSEQLNSSSTLNAPLFGQILAPDNIDTILLHTRRKQQVFREQFPAYRAELDTIVLGR